MPTSTAGSRTGAADRPAAGLRQSMTRLRFQTIGPGMRDITREVAGWLGAIDAGEGLVTVFIRHTSASLAIQENADPDVQHDLIAALSALAPENAPYRHQTEGPDDMPAHIKSMMTATSLQIPVADGAMLLGTWQGIYLIEHRTSGRVREIVLTYQGE